MRAAVVVLIGLLGILQYQLIFDDGGLLSLGHVKKQMAKLASTNDKLRQGNRALAFEVADLKRGDEAVVERARRELGMVKSGEVYYHILEGSLTSGPQSS